MNYCGPIINKRYFKKAFCKNFLPNDGFIKVKYVNIVDGDTAFFEVNKCHECVRFMVINAPKYLETPEPFGQEAKDFVKEELEKAKEIYLESDKANNLRDDTLSQRLLAWIWVDGKLLNYMIVRNGLADNKFILNNKMKHLSFMKKAYIEAKKDGLGIHKK